ALDRAGGGVAGVRQGRVGGGEEVEHPVLPLQIESGDAGLVVLQLNAEVLLHRRVDRLVQREAKRAGVVHVLVRLGGDRLGGARGRRLLCEQRRRRQQHHQSGEQPS